MTTLIVTDREKDVIKKAVKSPLHSGLLITDISETFKN